VRIKVFSADFTPGSINLLSVLYPKPSSTAYCFCLPSDLTGSRPEIKPICIAKESVVYAARAAYPATALRAQSGSKDNNPQSSRVFIWIPW
jgi:hypothetical protein